MFHYLTASTFISAWYCKFSMGGKNMQDFPQCGIQTSWPCPSTAVGLFIQTTVCSTSLQTQPSPLCVNQTGRRELSDDRTRVYIGVLRKHTPVTADTAVSESVWSSTKIISTGVDPSVDLKQDMQVVQCEVWQGNCPPSLPNNCQLPFRNQ